MADLAILLPGGDLARHQELACHFEPVLRAHYNVAPLAIARPDIVACLTASAKPKAVILADDAIVSSKKHNWLLTHLVDYLSAGGTLILGFAFACHHNGPRFDKLMRERFGLPWRASTCMRTTHELQGPFRHILNSVLVTRYSQHARTLISVSRHARVYIPIPTRKSPENQAKTAVAFEKCQGNGYLAYIGDRAVTDGSQAVVMAILHFAMQRAREKSESNATPVTEPTRVTGPTPAANPAPIPAAARLADLTSVASKTAAATPATSAPLPPPQAKTCCGVCGKASQHKCGGCRVTSYCSRDCQRADWPIHTKICGTLCTQAVDSAQSAGASGHQKAAGTPAQATSWIEDEPQTAAKGKGKGKGKDRPDKANMTDASGPAKVSAPTSRVNESASKPKKGQSQSKPAPGPTQGTSQATPGTSNAKPPPSQPGLPEGLDDLFGKLGFLPGDVQVSMSAPDATSQPLFPAFMNLGSGAGPELSVLFAGMTLSETIKRVIQTYKLRVEDQYVLSKIASGLYAVPAGTLPVAHFEVFLDKLERCLDLLPAWWDALAREACVETACTPGDALYIGTSAQPGEIGDDHMMSMMRIVSGAVYGTGKITVD